MNPQQSQISIPPAGLISFFTSQATAMLVQYENITQLLGQTSDYTGPGTHCEVLLRTFIRQYLPGYLSADKGFVLGRREATGAAGKGQHCPEIDILLHEIHHCKPAFRLDDFVIVTGRAARGAIQVKRTMSKTALAEAIDNVIDARRHASLASGLSGTFFSAVIFFAESHPRSDGQISATYENVIRDKLTDPDNWPYAPDCIGSLQNHICYRRLYGNDQLEYVTVPSVVCNADGNHNISLQIFLTSMAAQLFSVGFDMPTAYPNIPPAQITAISIPRS